MSAHEFSFLRIHHSTSGIVQHPFPSAVCCFSTHDRTRRSKTMLDRSPISTKNQILNALPDEDRERLRPHLERVELPSGKVLYMPDQKIPYVYFPDAAMI